MDGTMGRLLDTLDVLVGPLGVAAFTAGALVQFVPRSRVREKLACIVHVGQLLAVLLWLMFWNRHFLIYADIKANILMNGFGAASIAFWLWRFSKSYTWLHKERNQP